MESDRGCVFIKYGSPDKIESKPTGDTGNYPSERWFYRHIEGIGDDVEIFFVDKTGKGDYVFDMPRTRDII